MKKDTKIAKKVDLNTKDDTIERSHRDYGEFEDFGVDPGL